MSGQNKNDQSVVKTSDLIYVFCAAAWVNVLTNSFSESISPYCFLLAFLTFALIPLEIYTGSLWQQAAALVEPDHSSDALQQAVLASIDILRLFALSMAFILLNVPIDSIKNWYNISPKHQASVEAYLFFIALFTFSNWIWNQILFRGKCRRGTSERKDLYNALIQKYQAIMKPPSVHPDDTHLSNFAVDFTVVFGVINRIIFEYIFGIAFVALFAIVIISTAHQPMHDWSFKYAGMLSILFFSLQICAKLIQIIFFSNLVSDVRNASKGAVI